MRDHDARALMEILLPNGEPSLDRVTPGVVRLAGTNRVVGELRARVAASPSAPPWLLREIEVRMLAIAHTNGVKTRAARALGEAFATRGISCVALKGLHLAHAVYSNSNDRPFGDVDILIKPSDRATAERALEQEGCVPGLTQTGEGAIEASFVRTLDAGVALDVDLHWALVGSLSLVWRMNLDVEGMLARSVVGWPGIRFPAPEDAMVLAALNLVRHGFRPLGNILDLREILRLCDPQVLVRRAKESRTQAALSAGLGLASALFGADIPSALTRALALPRWQQRTLRALLPLDAIVRPELATGPVARYGLKVLAQDGALGVAHTVSGLPGVLLRRLR